MPFGACQLKSKMDDASCDSRAATGDDTSVLVGEIDPFFRKLFSYVVGRSVSKTVFSQQALEEHVLAIRDVSTFDAFSRFGL